VTVNGRPRFVPGGLSFEAHDPSQKLRPIPLSFHISTWGGEQLIPLGTVRLDLRRALSAAMQARHAAEPSSLPNAAGSSTDQVRDVVSVCEPLSWCGVQCGQINCSLRLVLPSLPSPTASNASRQSSGSSRGGGGGPGGIFRKTSSMVGSMPPYFSRRSSLFGPGSISGRPSAAGPAVDEVSTTAATITRTPAIEEQRSLSEKESSPVRTSGDPSGRDDALSSLSEGMLMPRRIKTVA